MKRCKECGSAWVEVLLPKMKTDEVTLHCGLCGSLRLTDGPSDIQLLEQIRDSLHGIERTLSIMERTLAELLP